MKPGLAACTDIEDKRHCMVKTFKMKDYANVMEKIKFVNEFGMHGYILVINKLD